MEIESLRTITQSQKVLEKKPVEKFEATTFLKMAQEPLKIDLDLCEEEPSIFAE